MGLSLFASVGESLNLLNLSQEQKLLLIEWKADKFVLEISIAFYKINKNKHRDELHKKLENFFNFWQRMSLSKTA